MTEHALAITSTTESINTETLVSILQNAIPDTVLDEHSVEFHWESTIADGFDEHELGPCPYCDGTNFSVIEPVENEYDGTASGTVEYARRGELSGPFLNVYCGDCHDYVLRHPADVLLNYS